jgi:hypothetical protein
MGIGDIVLVRCSFPGRQTVSGHFKPNFFSTALRLLPADLTAAFGGQSTIDAIASIGSLVSLSRKRTLLIGCNMLCRVSGCTTPDSREKHLSPIGVVTTVVA